MSRRATLLTVLTVVAAACTSAASDPPPVPEWGHEAITYFETLAEALSTDDIYGALDFYTPEGSIQNRTSDYQDATVPVFDYLESFRADLSQNLIGVHLGTDQAVTLVEWPVSGRLGAAVFAMDGGLIAAQTDFTDIDSLERGLLASPDVAAEYRELYDRFVDAWTTDDAELAELYTEGATINDFSTTTGVSGLRDVEQLRSDSPVEVLPLGVSDIVPAVDGTRQGPAIYLDPVSFGNDPGRAVAAFAFERNGCAFRVAMLWELDAGKIAREYRYPEVESFRLCTGIDLPRGWWTGLELPGPRDEIVTGVIEIDGGRTIEVHNGTTRLESLVRWGFDRFSSAGLPLPELESVTFEPTRRCDGVGGRVDSGDDSHQLVLCIEDRDLCPDGRSCSAPLLAIRASMLHELGHAWLADHVDEGTRQDLLTLSGREEWLSKEVPWAERGVEYAAEVIAWGLIDEPIDLEQLGSPPCPELKEAFELLTGTDPVRGCQAAG